MRPRATATLVVALLIAAAVAPAAVAKQAWPEETGIVSRGPTSGGHTIEPKPVSVDGETRLMFTVFGWDDPITFCTDGAPVANGVEQLVSLPTGDFHLLVHNEDIPVMVFDVTEVPGPGAFFTGCAAGEIVPFATGEARQRPNIHISEDSFFAKVNSHGTVVEPDGTEWLLNARLQERDDSDGVTSQSKLILKQR
jgi:hypothetical protein